MSIQKSNDQADDGHSSILILRDGTARFINSSRVGASLRHFSVIMENAGSLTAEYGNTLFPRDQPYKFSFPRDPDQHRGNIDYRDENGVYFISPASGEFVVISEHAGAPDTYKNSITFINLKFEREGQEVTINGTGEATFVFET